MNDDKKKYPALQTTSPNPNPVYKKRRQTLQLLSGFILALPILPQFLWAEASDDGHYKKNQRHTINTFIALSAFLTTSNALNPEMGRQVLQQIIEEAWGKEHLQRVLKKIRLNEGGIFNTGMLKNFDKGETWFVGHLLTTWVTGTYFHESGNKVLSYKQALMYSAFRDIYPEPYECTSDFAYWQHPPG